MTKFISLGLQCSTPKGIEYSGFRKQSYPFDWLWTPGKTVHSILLILINQGVEETIKFMTTGYSYYHWMENENYEPAEETTNAKMNPRTGLGITTHFEINDEYIVTLRRRLTRLLDDIKSGEKIVFIYADAASPEKNYRLNRVVYGKDATIDLLQIHLLLYPINQQIEFLYFCWSERFTQSNYIKHIPFEYQDDWDYVALIISDYLKSHY